MVMPVDPLFDTFGARMLYPSPSSWCANASRFRKHPMSTIRSIYYLTRSRAAAGKQRYRHFRYVDLDIAKQRRARAGEAVIGAPSEVIAMDQSHPEGVAVIFVHYDPMGRLHPNVVRVLSELKKNRVHVYFATNSLLAEDELAVLSDYVHSVFIRDNTGLDFGAFREVSLYLLHLADRYDRVGYLNDSVYYAREGLDKFFADFLCPQPENPAAHCVAAYENWGEGYHVQSFSVSVGESIFYSPQIENFWKSYEPLNNRIHAIEMGEKKFSKAILDLAESSEVLYSCGKLYEVMRDMGAEDYDYSPTIIIPHQWRDLLREIQTRRGSLIDFASEMCTIVNLTSPVHSGAYLFPRYLRSPIFKRDLVYRQRYSFWEIETWLPSLLGADDSTEFLTLLRKKGDEKSLSGEALERYRVGAL